MKILNQIRLILVISIALVFSFINTNAASYFFSYSGHTYEIVDQKKTWTDATTYATGKGGYLVHIESSGEQSAIWSAITTGAQIPTTYTVINDGGGIAYIWIGATDKSTEGTWLWDGNNDNTGTNFWKGQGAGGAGDGVAINGAYNNWGGASGGSPKEPDDYGSNQDGAGLALEPWPKNMGIMGTSGEWNDLSTSNQAYFIIEYDYPGKPGKAAVPVGNTEMCQDAANTQYTSTGADNAVSYNWYISPSNAGVISGGTTTGTVDWSKDFNGTAQIYLVGVNPVGVGDTSNKISVVVISFPDKPTAPMGADSLDIKTSKKSSYTIEKSNGAESYKWELSPTTAGQLTPNSTECEIKWNSEFKGKAQLKVKAVNKCGETEFSNSKEIVVYESNNTDVKEMNSSISIYPNPASNFVQIENTSKFDFNNIKIYDFKGELQLNKDVVDCRNLSINLIALNSGAYIIILSNNYEVQYFKIVKE